MRRAAPTSVSQSIVTPACQRLAVAANKTLWLDRESASWRIELTAIGLLGSAALSTSERSDRPGPHFETYRTHLPLESGREALAEAHRRKQLLAPIARIANLLLRNPSAGHVGRMRNLGSDRRVAETTSQNGSTAARMEGV